MSEYIELATAVILDVLVTVAYLLGELVKAVQLLIGAVVREIGHLSLESWVCLIFLATAYCFFQSVRLRRRVRRLETTQSVGGGLATSVAQLKQQQRALAHEIEALEMHVFSGDNRLARRQPQHPTQPN
jgi:hypothetical protein